MKKPKISIILPTYNRGYIIQKAITSVLKQSFQDFELLIIDDNSSDNTREIVEKIQSEKIIYIKRPINSNITKENARNDGLLNARGEYIAYIDSDNTWLKNHLKILNEILDNNKKIGLVYCDSWIWRDGKKRLERSYDFYKGMKIPFPFIDTGEMMHRKSCIKRAGVWGYYDPPRDDWYFFIKISKFYNMQHVKVVLCNYYCSNPLQNAQAFLKEAKRLYKRNNKTTKSVIRYLKYVLLSCSKCIGRQEKKAIKIENTAKMMLLFKNKKEIDKIL